MNRLSVEQKQAFLASVPRGNRIFGINSLDEVTAKHVQLKGVAVRRRTPVVSPCYLTCGGKQGDRGLGICVRAHVVAKVHKLERRAHAGACVCA